MRHYKQTGYGAARQNMALVEAADPIPGANDVMIGVYAAALNPIDFKLILGELKAVKKLNFPAPMGFDGSGIVWATGAGVTGFKTGDAVYFRTSFDRRGTFAEAVAVDQAIVAVVPKGLSFGDAASLPLVGMTTIQLFDLAATQPGQSILIHAGSGGIGSFAIQYAKAKGLHVTTTTSRRNAALVAGLGADVVICYDNEDYRQRPARYDIVFDTLGGDFTVDAFSVLKSGGVVISTSGPPSAYLAGQLKAGFVVRTVMAVLRRKVSAAAKRIGARYFSVFSEVDGAQLAAITALVEAGQIRPVIDRHFAFEALAEAMAYLETGRARGKVILDVRA